MAAATSTETRPPAPDTPTRSSPSRSTAAATSSSTDTGSSFGSYRPPAIRAIGDEVLHWISFNGEPMSFPRWVLVNQSVHHATEHRAQIAGALAANGITSVDLDAIDVWSLSDEDSASR